MRKIIKINNFDSIETISGTGYIRVSTDILINIFGHPEKTDSHKTDWIWRLTLDNNDVIEIYDWKIGKNYNNDHGLELEEINLWCTGSSGSDYKKRVENKRYLENLISLCKEDWGSSNNTKLKMFFNLEET